MFEKKAPTHDANVAGRSLADGVPVGLYRTSVAGLILEANSTLIQISGYPGRDTLVGSNAAAVYVDPGERIRWQEAMDRDGVVRDFEVQIRRYDGTIIWVKDSARAVRDENGRILYYEGILEEITERKQVAEALRRRDAVLEALAFTSQKLFVQADLNHTFSDVLADIGTAVAVSRAYVFENKRAADGAYLTSQRCEWVAHGQLSQSDNAVLYHVHYEELGFGRWIELLESGLPLYGLVETFPPEEQEILQPQGILSIAVFPIHVDGEWWGFLGLDDCEQERTWTNVEITALKSTAGVLAGVIGNARLYESERRARERAEVMGEVAQTIAASLDRNEILRRSLSQLRRVLTFDMGSVYVFGENSRAELIVTPGYPDETLTVCEALRLLEHSPIFQDIRDNLQSVISGDVRRLPGWIWIPGAEAIRSFMAVPLAIRGRMIGALMVDSRHENFFTETDMQIVQTLAQHVAIAVENAYLFEAVQRSLAEQTALLAASTAVSSTLDLPTVLSRVAEQLGLALDVTSVYIVDWDAERQTSTVLARYYSDGATPEERVSDMGATYDLVSNFGILSNFSPDSTTLLQVNDPHLPEAERAQMRQRGAKSILTVPLIIKEKVLGYSELWESRYQREFTPAEIRLARGIVQQAAIAFEHARLFELQRTQLRLFQTLQAVGALLTTSIRPEALCEQIFDLLAQVVTYDSVSIQLLDDKGKLSLLASRGYGNLEQVRQSTQNLDVDLLRQRWQGRRMMVVADTQMAEEWEQPPMSSDIRSWIGAALTIQGGMVGILNVNSSQINAYNAAVGEMVVAFANQAAVAIENARLFAAERRQLRLSQTLQQVGALLTSRLSLNEVFEQILDLLSQVVAYDSVSIQLIDGEETYMAAGRGFPDHALSQKIVSQITTPTLKQRWGDDQKIIVLPDTHRDERWNTSLGNEYIRSWIGAALRVKGRLLGIVNVDSATPHAYDTETGEMVLAFANQAGVAIENARLHEETRQRAKELAILHQVALATAATVNVDDLIQQTTELIAATLYPDVFGFVLIDSTTGKLQPHPTYHGIPGHALKQNIPYESSVTGYVARTGQPLLLKDVTRDPLYYQVLPTTRSEVAVPLNVRERVRGVINVESPQLNAFSENDVRFLTTLAGQVSIALERATLYESLQEYTAHLAQEVNRRTAELRAERDRNLAVLDSAGEGVFFTDCHGVILYVNPAMTRLTGYTVVESLGQTPRLWHAVSHAVTHAVTHAASHAVSHAVTHAGSETASAVDPYRKMWVAIQRGVAWSGEMVNRRRDGSFYDAHLTMAPIHSTIGELTGFVGIQSDISHLKEVDRLKSKFVSNVSHELRTPLTNIKTYLTLLQRGKPERKEHYLAVLQHETDRLTALIQHLLDLSRLETEAAPLQLQPTDVYEVAVRLMDSFMAKAESKQIKLHLELSPGLPKAMAEPYRLEQVLTNLVGNALAYSDDGGKVVIRAGAEQNETDSHLWLSVTDNGPGIPPEEMPRLFERFFRGQLAHERNIPGTGLGLAICKEIIERHQGSLEVESVPGEITVFRVRLLAVA
jgi:PAS domain S-box-containing protein